MAISRFLALAFAAAFFLVLFSGGICDAPALGKLGKKGATEKNNNKKTIEALQDELHFHKQSAKTILKRLGDRRRGRRCDSGSSISSSDSDPSMVYVRMAMQKVMDIGEKAPTQSLVGKIKATQGGREEYLLEEAMNAGKRYHETRAEMLKEKKRERLLSTESLTVSLTVGKTEKELQQRQMLLAESAEAASQAASQAAPQASPPTNESWGRYAIMKELLNGGRESRSFMRRVPSVE